MLEIAISQKRDFAYVHFSGDHNPDHLKVDYFRKEDVYSIEKLLEMVEYFDGGGTNFEAPLTKSKQIIDKDESFSKADIIFVTDGGAPITDKFKDDFNKWKKERNVNVFSILIDTGYSSIASLLEFTKKENIFRLSDMDDASQDDLAVTLFDQI